MATPIKFEPGVDLNNQRGINAASPSAPTDLVNKAYADNIASGIGGIAFKDEVRVATTTNGANATAFANGQTIDGVSLTTGMRILRKDQTDPKENGIFTVNASGAPTRATDGDSTGDLNNALVPITSGTVNAGRMYRQITQDPVIGTDNIVWTWFQPGITYTADGNGIELVGTEFQIELDGSTLAKSSAGLRVGSGAAGAGLTQASGVLAVGQGTGITVNADDVAIDPSVVSRHYATSIGDGSSTDIAVTHNLGTKDIKPVFRENATDKPIVLDWTSTSTTVMTVNLAVPATSNQYRVAIEA